VIIARVIIASDYCQVRIELENTDYATALACHEKNIPISCTGDLELDGRVWVLTNPIGLDICSGKGYS
jgi:hypothetical protein